MYKVCSVTELNRRGTFAANSQQKPGMFCYLVYSYFFPTLSTLQNID